MDDLFVECPIHLDAVSIKEILVFNCGHGFCEPCLDEHFTHHARLNLSCPTCRKPIRRKEAFPLFLVPAQPGATQSSHSTVEVHTRLSKELREARAAHASCSERFIELQHEIGALRQDSAHQNQTIQHLRDRYELLDKRLAKEATSFARVKEENNQLKEEVAKLQAENHKASRALEQVVKDKQALHDRTKLFQGYIEQYKRKVNLEKKKRKAIGNANNHLQPRQEDESLMVVDSNAPDTLYQGGPDFGWLDEACKVKGDPFDVPGDEDLEHERDSEDEVQFSDPNTKQKEDQILGPPLRFSSDWNFRLESTSGTSSGVTRKQKHRGTTKQVGGSKMVRVKMSAGIGTRKLGSGPLVIDGQGRVKGAVVLGSRQKLNSKN